MQKTLLFYDLILEKDQQYNLFNINTTLKNKVKDFLDNAKEEDYLYATDSVIIQIENLDENYIFGSYGKVENLSEKLMTRGRTKDDYSVTDLNSLKELVESYTYFYLDLNLNQCIILNNSKCRGFKTEFSKFISLHFRASSIYKKIEVVNKISKEINENIGKANHFANISYTYTSEKIPENEFISLKEISGLTNDQIRTASVQLYLNPKLDYSKSANKLANSSEYINNFDSFKIDTEHETIDVIEKMLSKKVSIKIDEDDVNNLDKIKEILHSNLISY